MTAAHAPIYGPRFDAALRYASRLHRGQTRKGTPTPFITHLLAVAAVVGEYGGGEDDVIAALLHDAVEDQGGRATLAAIRERFGPNVAAIVLDCSDTDITPKPPWCARKVAYLEHIRALSPSALLVSAADKLHNARSVVADLRMHGDALWGRFNAPKDAQLWYYVRLVDAFRERCAALRQSGAAVERHGHLLDELGRVVDEMLTCSGVTREQALAYRCVDPVRPA